MTDYKILEENNKNKEKQIKLNRELLNDKFYTYKHKENNDKLNSIGIETEQISEFLDKLALCTYNTDSFYIVYESATFFVILFLITLIFAAHEK